MVRIGDTVEAHQVNHIQLTNLYRPNLTAESGMLFLLAGKKSVKLSMPLALAANNSTMVENMTTCLMWMCKRVHLR